MNKKPYRLIIHFRGHYMDSYFESLERARNAIYDLDLVNNPNVLGYEIENAESGESWTWIRGEYMKIN